MFTTIINEQFETERQWIEQIPATFDQNGEIVQAKRNRNILRKVAHKDRMYNIKSFHVPSLFNRFVYTFFRKSKALRSYEHALLLKEKGIGTPEPVALITEKRHGLIARSYYVCLQLPDDYQEIRYCYWGPLQGNEETLRAFARFTARLHNLGIYHKDYSPGNILFCGDDFQLVDINRMSFREVPLDLACRNFARLFECDEIYRFLAREYAKERGFAPEECEALIMKYQKDFNIRKRRKRRLKKLFNPNNSLMTDLD